MERAFGKRMLCCVLFITCCCFHISAQQYQIQLLRAAEESEYTAINLPSPKEKFTPAAAIHYLQNLVPSLQQKGYLAASLDSVYLQDTIYRVTYFVGPLFQKAFLILDSLPNELFANRIVEEKQWQPNIWNAQKVAAQTQKILRYYENNGYPFAQVKFTQTSMDSLGNLYATWQVEKSKKRTIDSIYMAGETQVVKRNYLLKYLSLKQGEWYNEKKLSAISARIAELPFLMERTPWNVTFEPTYTRINFDLQERKANQLNAMVGLQPNTKATGKFLFTVDALFAFKNLLGYGESFSFSYQNLQYRSPKLIIDAAWPYLLQTDLGADLGFELFQNDLQFRRTSYRAGLRYILNANDELKVIYKQTTNRIQAFDTIAVKQNFQLPANADFKSSGIGFEVRWVRTDYKINPRKGWNTWVSILGNRRKILSNNEVLQYTTPTKDYQKLYDSSNSHPDQVFIQGDISGYLPIQQNLTLKSTFYGGFIYGKQLFRNELFQIGGSRLLRGFDEQSLFVNEYAILSLELRYYMAANSFVHVFSDNGQLKSSYNGHHTEGFYYGFGAGVSFENKTGLFSLTYGLGGAPQQPVQLRQSKIHFGYVAFF